MTEETKPRGPLAQALKQLEEERALRNACAEQLEQAASLRCGLMDSDSRRAEVQALVQQAIAQVAKRLRGVP